MHDKTRFFRFFTLYSFGATCAVWFASYLFGGLPSEQQAWFGTMVPQVLPWLCGISLAITGLSATCFATLRSMVRPLAMTVERVVVDERTNRTIEKLQVRLMYHRSCCRDAEHDLARRPHEIKIRELQEQINAERSKLGIPVTARPFDELH